jgi:hypothetical protein
MTIADELESAKIEEMQLSGEKRLSDDISTLEAEAAQMTLEKEKAEKAILDLRAAEDPVKRITHHEEIFNMQQEKLRLEVDIKFRTNKINRIKLGIDEMDSSEGVKNGFLF